jgi:eukaryotic-like serine/threonine-protein kinase
MPAPAAVAPLDRTAFFGALRAAEVLSPAQLAKAKTVAATGSAADAASALVAAGLLTPFQADRLLAGRTDGFVLGPYVILEQVGRGSVSRVYKAKHRTMHRTVAIKVLSSELTDTSEHREALADAVRDAGKLAHANIVTAYDASEWNERFYLVLEFVDGPDLGALVKSRGPLPLAEACEFVRQIATGLEHAHERGMPHRDLKPANLLVARPTPSSLPIVKIADFGLPKASAEGEFAAPEMLGPRAERADHRSDLYSLGRIFYFLLTGRSGGESLPLVQLRPDVPPAVAAIVHRLLAPNPNDRFTSATELLQHIGAACVPVALPVEGAVNFDLPVCPAYPAYDGGYLTGRQQIPQAAADTSPWAEITSATEDDAASHNPDDTPIPPHKLRLPGRGESVPTWMVAFFFVCFVLLSMMGIGFVVRTLAK